MTIRDSAGYIAKRYGLVIAAGVVMAGGMIYATSVQADVSELSSEIATLEQDIVEQQRLLTVAEQPIDKEAQKQVIQNRTVSAKKIADEFIPVDDTLTAFYKTSGDLPTDESELKALQQAVEEAKALNTQLTGASEADHIQTWQLNPEWTLSLESVVTYRDTDRVPVVFRMTTKDGEPAGLVYATYDVQKNQLSNVTRHYTPAGINNQADIGGR